MLTLSLPAPAGAAQGSAFVALPSPFPSPSRLCFPGPQEWKATGLEQCIHPGRLEQQAGPGGVAALSSGEGRRSPAVARPRPPLTFRPGAALTREDPAVPGEEGGPHGEAAVRAVGGLLGLLAGQQQPLDVLRLQGGAGPLLGHVAPPGPAEKRKGARGRCGLGPAATAAPPPGVCPGRAAARCAPPGLLGRAGEGEAWGRQRVCVCAVPARMPRVHGRFIRSLGDRSHCRHAPMSEEVRGWVPLCRT